MATAKKEKKLMDGLNKKQQALVVVGALAVGYLGLRAVAVAMDPKVHDAVKTAVKSTAGAGVRAARS